MLMRTSRETQGMYRTGKRRERRREIPRGNFTEKKKSQIILDSVDTLMC